MRFTDLIEEKKAGKALTKEEISWWIKSYVKGKIPDYQVSALLMAIVFRGMNEEETLNLTLEMMHSGDILDLSSINGVTVDKHSTGGVGDKTSLVLGPLAASCGVKMAKMSGRGLGFTGGTIDKLESIPGFSTVMPRDHFLRQVNRIGFAIVGQTGNLVPADKKLYALRDVTGTVNSIPLIASSIMSKKLAAGSQVILLDVKYGSGAFMKTKEDARRLAGTMIRIGEGAGRRMTAMITDMQTPLGCAIGNRLEVMEAVQTLAGGGPADLKELCMAGGRLLLTRSGLAADAEEADRKLEQALSSGAALEKLAQMVHAQGGDESCIYHPEKLLQAPHRTALVSPAGGWVVREDALTLGEAAMRLGAGRAKKDDRIDPDAGIVLQVKPGQQIEEGQPLAYVYHRDLLTEEWTRHVMSAFEIGSEKPETVPLIEEVLE